MKLKKGSLLKFLDFDSVYCLLSVRNTKILHELFKMLDIFNKGTLNDVQFCAFMKNTTDLGKKDIMLVFEMLDQEASGTINFNEFYMLVCMLLCSEFSVEKNFILRYSQTIFELLDMDGSETVSLAEFKTIGFLFNLKDYGIKNVFQEFDLSGDERLSYKEFKMFTLACFDMQKKAEEEVYE